MPDPTFEAGGLDARTEASIWFARGIGLVSGGLVVVAVTAGLIGAGRVLLLVFFAVLVASALGPLVDRLRTSLPIGRGVSILLVYATFFVSVAAIGFFLVPVAISQASDMMNQVPAILDRVESWSGGLQPPELATSVGALVTAVRAALSGPSPGTGQVVSAGLGLADATISAVTILALVFFWMTERQRLQRFTLSFLPAERRGGVREAWNIVEVRLGGWVRGQLLLMISLGLMTGVAYTAMGLPSGPTLGVIAGLAEVVPLVGPALGVVPALLIAAAFRPDLLVIVVAVYVLIQLAESNFLVPLVMRNAVGVSPFLLTVSLLIGAALGGILGALVAVPMVAAVEAILERMQDRQVPVAQDAASATAGAMPSEENTMEPPRTEA
jgi:predicted PurR-regulated permease PerM